MKSTVLERTDAEIQQQVIQELHWDPRVDETEVGVQVARGVVTLTGKIGSYGKKLAATEAAHKVFGVLDVANDLEVQIGESERISDTAIAQAVRDSLRWNVFVPEKDIASTVSDGWVTLQGQVSEWFQKDAITRAVRDLGGVRGVTNEVLVRARSVDAPAIRTAITTALARQASQEAKQVGIQVLDGVVTLTGSVRSWSDKLAVERAAGFTPGVTRVQNQLVIDHTS